MRLEFLDGNLDVAQSQHVFGVRIVPRVGENTG